MKKMGRRNFLKTGGKLGLIGIISFSPDKILIGRAFCSYQNDSIIGIGDFELNASKKDVKIFKGLLDKLGRDYILDDVQFNLTEPTVGLMKAVYEVDYWKVGKDGSVSLKNMYGHSGKFEYKRIWVSGLPNKRILELRKNKLNDSEISLLRNLSEKVYYKNLSKKISIVAE